MNTPTSSIEDRFELTLPSGKVFPDWSVIASPKAGEALHTVLNAFGAKERHRGLSQHSHAVQIAVLRLYAELGRAPSGTELERSVGLGAFTVEAALSDLETRDLLVRDGDEIVGAYPFTSRPTEHRVVLGDVIVHAMCAVDALGVGAMLERDVEIRSVCRQCGGEIYVETGGKGTTLRPSASAPSVWLGNHYQGCAADSLCTVIAFFCSEDHLDSWRGVAAVDLQGHQLTLEEAFQVGRALFAPRRAGDAG